MVESYDNIIDFSFLDSNEKRNYSVLIILNRPIVKDLFFKLRDKVDYIICADGAANRMFDNLGEPNNLSLPDCIVGDFDSIRPEVQEFYVSKGVKLYKREDVDTTDLEKCLYVSLEKISEASNISNEQENKELSIIILGASGGRIDHTFSAFSQVYKYLENYSFQFKGIEIILLSKGSCSVYLKNGMNKILTSSTWEEKSLGYSIVAVNGECNIEVIEDDKTKFCAEKLIKFGESFFFRKKHDAKTINVDVNCEEGKSVAVIYSFTTIFHN